MGSVQFVKLDQSGRDLRDHLILAPSLTDEETDIQKEVLTLFRDRAGSRNTMPFPILLALSLSHPRIAGDC